MRVGLLILATGLALLGAESKVTHVVESDGVRVTVSTKKQGKLEPGAMRGLAMIYLKIENLADLPLEFKQDSAYLLAASGKSLRRITPEEATGVIQTMPLMRTLTRAANMDNPALIAAEPKRKELAAGPIPPKTWREGLLYFEGTGDAGRQKQPVKLFLPPFIKEGLDINW